MINRTMPDSRWISLNQVNISTYSIYLGRLVHAFNLEHICIRKSLYILNLKDVAITYNLNGLYFKLILRCHNIFVYQAVEL